MKIKYLPLAILLPIVDSKANTLPRLGSALAHNGIGVNNIEKPSGRCMNNRSMFFIHH